MRPGFTLARCAQALVAFLAIASSSLFLNACTTSTQPALSAFLWPAPSLPVVHRPRRPPYKPYVPFTMAYKLDAPVRTDWAARLAELPKDASGAIDWVKALDEKLIEPKPGLDDKTEDEPVLDMEVELIPKDAPDFKVAYPHKIHTELLACRNCHTDIFQMEKGADAITMDKIFAGEYCGRCHGKVAFDVASGCPRCHLGMPK